MAPELKRKQADIEEIDLTGDYHPELTALPHKKMRSMEREPTPATDTDDDASSDEDDDFRELSQEEIQKLIAEVSTRSLNLPEDCRRINKAQTSIGSVVVPGSTVELQDGDFLRIAKMFQHRKEGVFLEGTLLRRTRSVQNWLKKERNELCAMMNAPANRHGPDPSIKECLVTRHLSEASITREVIFTNQEFPAHSYRLIPREYHHDKAIADRHIEDACELVCRRKYITYFDSAGKPASQALVWLSFTESDSGKRISNVQRWRNWVGKRRTTLVLEDAHHTYGDVFTGAGGTMRGAKSAGLDTVFAVDNAHDQCESLRLNFPGCKIFKIEIAAFCTSEYSNRKWAKVDILHGSPPCQYFSPNHTRDGKNDEDNIAALFSFVELVKKHRPRIITLEETPGLVQIMKHRDYFNALVHQLADNGYSLRWDIINFADTGNPQPRKRLWFYGSCPGEPLPQFPKATHGNDPGLQKPTTIYDILKQIPRTIANHMMQFTKKDTMPYDSRKPLRHCITTDGGKGDNHPDGGRSFTLQELAQLAGFPWFHKFFGSKTSIRQQIGNAVPAIAVTPYFEAALKSMQEWDKKVRAEMTEVISID